MSETSPSLVAESSARVVAPSGRTARSELAGGELDLPYDFTGEARCGPTPRGTRGLMLLPAFTGRIEKLADEERTTHVTVVLAAWQAFLHRWSRGDQVVVGINRGRTLDLLVRTRLAGALSFREVVRRVRDAGVTQLHAGYRAQAGFGRARETAGSDCELLLRWDLAPGGAIALTLDYDGRRFTAQTAERLLRDYDSLLHAFVESPESRMDRLTDCGGHRDVQLEALGSDDELEQQLMRIWENVLGARSIGVDDRFRDLGGHSLHAMQIAAKVERQFGRRIPVSILFRAPTVGSLARVLREEGRSEPGSTVVELQPAGSRPPIFWLHTLGGDNGAGLFTYEPIVRHLGSEQPSYGLVAPPGPPLATLEEMAAFHVGKIRATRPEGPYILAGYCFGGVLAYETARQLMASGAEVKRVILIDAGPPNPPGLPGPKSWAFASHVIREFPAWLAMVLGKPRDFLSRLTHFGRRLGARLRRTQRPGATDDLGQHIDMTKYPADYKSIAEAHWRAYRNYHPKPVPGLDLLLLRTHRPRIGMFPLEYQWRLLSPVVDCEVVPGNHESLLEEPHVAAVAAAINRRLR